MRTFVRLPLALLVCACASGCITSITAIQVKPDGSGTIEQTMAMKAEMAQQFAAMASGMADASGKPGAKAEAPEFFSEKEMREAATKYGEGVTYVSSKPIKNGEMVGRVATYAFTDITKLKVNQKPPSPAGNMAPEKASATEDVQFKFAKQPSGSSLLTIVFPDTFDKNNKPAEKKTTPTKKPDPAQLEMMKKMLDGMHIEIGLDVAGTILKTNSPYVQGSHVTLLEMDFSQMLQNPEALDHLTEPGSIEEAKKMLAGLKGVKATLEKETFVEFK